MKKFLLFFVCYIQFCTLQAQWEKLTATTYGSFSVNCIVANDTQIIIGTDKGIYLSTDHTSTWTDISKDLTRKNVLSLLFDGTTIFAGTDSGLYVSNFPLIDWTLDSAFIGNEVSLLAGKGSMLFAVSDQALFRSEDHGIHWVGLSNYFNTYETFESIQFSGSNVLAKVEECLYISSDSGTTWKNLKCFYWFGDPFAVKDSDIYVADGDSFYFSPDMGSHWKVNSLTPNAYIRYINNGVNSLMICNNIIYLSWDMGDFYISSDNGINWQSASNGLNMSIVTSFAANKKELLLGTTYGLYVSKDNGSNWRNVKNNLDLISAGVGTSYGKNMIEISNNELLITRDNGMSYSVLSHNCIFPFPGVMNFFTIGKDIYVVAGKNELFVSYDSGLNWKSLYKGFDTFSIYYLSINVIGTDLYAIGNYNYNPNNCYYKSTDGGSNWTKGNLVPKFQLMKILSDGKYLYAMIDSFCLYKSEDNGITWTYMQNMDIATRCQPTSLVITPYGIFTSTFGKGIFYTGDEGKNWIPLNNGIPYPYTFLFYFQPGYLLAESEEILPDNYPHDTVFPRHIKYYGKILLSSDNGLSWNPIYSDSDVRYVSLFMNESYVFIYHDKSWWRMPLPKLPDAGNGKMYLYPNPASDHLNFGVTEGKYFNVTILNSSGKIVKQLYLQNPISQIEISDLSPGIYLIWMYDGKTRYANKFIKD